MFGRWSDIILLLEMAKPRILIVFSDVLAALANTSHPFTKSAGYSLIVEERSTGRTRCMCPVKRSVAGESSSKSSLDIAGVPAEAIRIELSDAAEGQRT